MPNNLSGATKKSIYESRVSQLDNFGEGADVFESVDPVIENILSDFILRVHQNINQAKIPVSGKISDMSIESVDGEVVIYAHPHLLYQDKGVSGVVTKYADSPYSYTNKMPPASVFKEWMKSKNIQLRDNSTYYGPESPFKDLTEDEKLDRAAWAMAKNVQLHGIKPKNFFSKELEKLEQDLVDQVGDFLADSIKIVI